MARPKGKGPRVRQCADCGKYVPIEEEGGLYTKFSGWRLPGRSGRLVRVRSLKYQCADCASRDPDWNRKPYYEAPGKDGHRGREEAEAEVQPRHPAGDAGP